MILENLKKIEDLKGLTIEELKQLATECRQLVSAFGKAEGAAEVIELAIAIHYVFELTDSFILDAPYTPSHTILTGRISSLLGSYDVLPTPTAKEYVENTDNLFTLGHSTSALNVAVGLAKARELRNLKGNVIVCLDAASFHGSSIFDELNVVGRTKSNLIILINDNGSAVASDNTFIQYLNDIRQNASELDHNLFRNLGIDYKYVSEGNDVQQIVEALSVAKDLQQPIILHLNTQSSSRQSDTLAALKPTAYSDLTYQVLNRIAATDDKLVVLSSGTPQVMGFTKERQEQFGRHFMEIGQSEQALVGVANGLAKAGCHPVWGVYSTFLQRVYDHLLQDIAINRSPVAILVFGGGIDGMNNSAHEGFFDISMSVNIPNITVLAPTCQEAYEAMLQWAVKQNEGPVVIRVPNDEVHHATYPVDVTTARFGNYQITHEGSEVAIFGVGTYYPLAVEVAELLTREDVDATIVNPRNLNLYDVETLEDLRQRHRLVVTLEDGVMAGGFGEKIARYYGPSRMKVMVRGLHKQFEDNYDVRELREKNRLLPEQIANDILDIIL